MGDALVSFGLSKLSKKKAKKTAGGFVPENIRTGNSSFNTRTGQFNIDPSIRAGLDNFETDIRGLKDPINTAFDTASSGIRDLQSRSAGIREGFEGNQSAFREAQLNPLRETIARREGQLDRSLNRTGVKGTFAEQSKNALAFEGARRLRNAEAEIENQRINKLGDFLQIDANLLKEGLASETGRIGLMAELSKTLAGISSEKFQQELALLGLPASFMSGNSAKTQAIMNAEGIEAQAGAELLGAGFDAFDSGGNSTPGMDDTGFTDNAGFGVG
jgi:hypothetical protein